MINNNIHFDYDVMLDRSWNREKLHHFLRILNPVELDAMNDFLNGWHHNMEGLSIFMRRQFEFFKSDIRNEESYCYTEMFETRLKVFKNILIAVLCKDTYRDPNDIRTIEVSSTLIPSLGCKIISYLRDMYTDYEGLDIYRSIRMIAIITSDLFVASRRNEEIVTLDPSIINDPGAPGPSSPLAIYHEQLKISILKVKQNCEKCLKLSKNGNKVILLKEEISELLKEMVDVYVNKYLNVMVTLLNEADIQSTA